MSEVFFGNTPNSDNLVAQNFTYFFPATCTQTGNVTSIRCKSGSQTGFNIVLAVYSSSGGVPDALLGQTSAISINATTTVFTSAVTVPFAVTNGTGYFLAWLKDGGSTAMNFDTGTGSDRFKAATYPTFPSPAGSTTGGTGTGYIEAGVTPGGGSTFVPLIVIL